MYQWVIDAVDPMLKEKYPDLETRWYQAGSEKVAQRAEAEWSAGGTKACLLLTSDVFWYQKLKEEGRLQRHFAPNVLHIDRSLVDPDGYWATARISLMVMAVNETRVPEDQRPTRLLDLTDAQWKDRFSMGDPRTSGTMFTTLAFLQREQGWPLFESLRDNGLVAAGGNSSVINRVETGEREIGVVLLENLLAAARKDSPAVPVFPEDGAIPVPGPVALTSDCGNPTAARAVYDFLLSPPGQQAIVDGDMYAALPQIAPPAGAPPLDTLKQRTWKPGFIEQVVKDKVALKERYDQLISGG